MLLKFSSLDFCCPLFPSLNFDLLHADSFIVLLSIRQFSLLYSFSLHFYPACLFFPFLIFEHLWPNKQGMERKEKLLEGNYTKNGFVECQGVGRIRHCWDHKNKKSTKVELDESFDGHYIYLLVSYFVYFLKKLL